LYGRHLWLKNAGSFRRAFAEAGTGMVLEEGELPHAEFLKRLSRARAIAVPSVSDVAPNTIIDAIRCGKPFLLTKYSGYAETFGRFGIIVDPLDEDDMRRGVQKLADPAIYESLRRNILEFRDVRTFDDVAMEFIAIVEGAAASRASR
jgi:glycosyltransferase involved in cell wall biosynthesis